MQGDLRSIRERIEPLLGSIERPSRYINHEYNSHSDEAAVYRVALLYPDTYEIGQPNQAIAILYSLINKLEGCAAERAYLPWVDMIAALRENDIPLFSLESTAPLASFDLLGITLPHELACTNVLEALDLAGLPLRAAERDSRHPLVIAGGPGAFNPEPLAPFFDAIVVGEGEEVMAELIAVHRNCLARKTSREVLLAQLARIEGVYVPSLYELDSSGRLVAKNADVPARIRRRIIKDFDAYPVVVEPVVPFAEIAHDRFTVEILRGCTRGCRFCQAGMIYRPVRERKADTIINAVAQGMANTGYEEVSLTSLSTTDHSQIEEILRRLNHMFSGTGISVSIPSQRLDGFGVAMAQLVAGERKAGLTFAPEAGTQRLRDSINKNVSENDLFKAVTSAFDAGWRRCKLYFMIGLPGETDEDVRGIAELANRAYAAAKDAVPEKQRGNVRMGISVAVFVPKAHTPFQWAGQIAREEIERRIQLLRNSGLHRGIDLSWHDPSSSRIEAALSRSGREAAALIETAWRLGANFDAWTERFKPELWEEAAEKCGLSIRGLAERDYDLAEPLPWDHIDSGIDKDFLAAELLASTTEQTSLDCSFDGCLDCGVCSDFDVSIVLAGESRG